MKLLTLVFLALSFSISAQNYSPFNENIPKRFHAINNSADNDFFFYPTETQNVGDSLHFIQYLKRTNQQVDVSGTYCDIWGGGFSPVIDSTWLGRNIYYDANLKVLNVINKEYENLSFDFNLSVGDSSLFYQSVTDSYFIKYDQIVLETIYGITDSVKHFEVLHFDQLNAISASPLNGFQIKVGKNLGTINFIDCKNFPFSEKGLTLMGQVNPLIGTYQMTFEEAFPWNSGDTIICYGLNSPDWNDTQTYVRYAVTSRVETVDSVYIYFDKTVDVIYPWPLNTPGAPTPPSPYYINYVSPIGFLKNDVIFDEPIGLSTGSVTYYVGDSVTECGSNFKIGYTGEFLSYCDSCNCLTAVDMNGSGYGIKYFTETEGVSQKGSRTYGNFTSSIHSEVIYSNIGGNACGTSYAVGLNEEKLTSSVWPNPASEEITIELSTLAQKIQLVDCFGKQLILIEPESLKTKMNTSELSPGVYFLVMEYDISQSTKMIVIQ